jgi:ketosteroid isomerase-like protein
MKLLPIAVLSLAALSLGRELAPRADAVAEVKAVLTDFHAAAAEGDADRYFGHMAPDAVFFGTDASERWPYDEYVALLRPYFEQGAKLESEPVAQNVYVSEDGKFAWFDERLEKPRYGEMRGTGVLRRTDDGWKLVQFHLTYPVPNEVLTDVVKLVRAAKKGR